MKRETKRRNNKGFSLVELIIVIAIMAILAGILAPQFIKYIKQSRISTDIQNAQQIATAISAEYADTATTDPVGTADAPISITSATAEKGWTDGTTAATGTIRAIKAVLGGTPTSKVESSANFAYYVNEDGAVTVYVVDGDTKTELYPSQPNDGKWKKD